MSSPSANNFNDIGNPDSEIFQDFAAQHPVANPVANPSSPKHAEPEASSEAADQPPVDQPPADQPLADQPPADQPPAVAAAPEVAEPTVYFTDKIVLRITAVYDRVEKAKNTKILRPKGLWDYTPEEVAAFKSGKPGATLGIKQFWYGAHDLCDFTKDSDQLQKQVALYGPPPDVLSSLDLPKVPHGLSAEKARPIWQGEGVHAFRIKADDGVTHADVARDMQERVQKQKDAIEAFHLRQKKEADRKAWLKSVIKTEGRTVPEKTGEQVVKELKEFIDLNRPIVPLPFVPSYKDQVEAADAVSQKRLREDYDHGLVHDAHKPVLAFENPRHPLYVKRKVMRMA